MTRRNIDAVCRRDCGGWILSAGALLTSKMLSVQAQNKPGYGFAALAGERVGQDVDGP